MKRDGKSRDPLPSRTASAEEVGAFWDTHDTTDYEDVFVTVDAEFDLRRRRYEVEIREDIYQAARERSEIQHVPVDEVIDEVLRRQLLATR